MDKEIVMADVEEGSEHRATERMDLALQISVPSQEGETVNISASGVYFEVITSELNSFSHGTTISIVINAVTNTPGCEERRVKLQGQGFVVRSDIKNVTSQSDRLGVASEFKDELDTSSDGT